MKHYFSPQMCFSVLSILSCVHCLFNDIIRDWWTFVKEGYKLWKKSREAEEGGGVPIKLFLHYNFSVLIIKMSYTHVVETSHCVVVFTTWKRYSIDPGVYNSVKNDWGVSLLYLLSITISVLCNNPSSKLGNTAMSIYLACESENWLNCLSDLTGIAQNCGKGLLFANVAWPQQR